MTAEYDSADSAEYDSADSAGGAMKEREVAALFVAQGSCYAAMPGVDCYTATRPAILFDLRCPVVAHPPCRMWSPKVRHQAKGTMSEMALGLWAISVVRVCGGVLEQPAGSRLLRHVPPGGQIVHVDQSWFGFPCIKKTWLWFWATTPGPVPFAFDPRGSRRAWQVMSRTARSRTCPLFGAWLVDAARRVRL